MTEIKVLAPAFPLSHSAYSYFCERKKRVAPRGGGEFMSTKIIRSIIAIFCDAFWTTNSRSPTIVHRRARSGWGTVRADVFGGTIDGL